MVRFCEVTNKLARVLLETASLKPMLLTLTSAKLLADRLFKISGEISSRGYFNKMLIEVSDEDSVYRACLDIFKDADNQIVMEACRDFKKVVEEIRKKLNEGC